MNIILFIFIVVLYNLCLAITDSSFNKIIRKNIDNWKEFKEYEYITICLLCGCLFLPWIIIFSFSETFAMIYTITTCFVLWDLIFGKIVYNKWLGDYPSAKFRGKWIKIELWKLIIIRITIGTILLLILIL